VANLFEVMEAGLEFPPPLLLGVLRDRLRGQLSRFTDDLPGEAKLVPPNSASLEKSHITPVRISSAHRYVGAQA
jgi:hypothetical protein